jgi:hypothetical protein
MDCFGGLEMLDDLLLQHLWRRQFGEHPCTVFVEEADWKALYCHR